ncbi:MAG TPA: hypothetical protein VGG14_14150 [Candidatus Sulfotelmatobacter sp.]|jgi:hypothetical protein
MSSTVCKVVLAAFTLWFLAQAGFSEQAQQQKTSSQPAQSSQAATDHTTNSRTAEITVRGCVNGDKRYTFMQANTGAIFALTEEPSDRFAPVRGKFIEITANEFAPQPNSNELPRLNVKTLNVVAEKCPITARAAARPKIDNGSRQAPPTASPDATQHVDPGTVNQTPPNVNNPNMTGATGAPSPGTGNPPPQNTSNSPQ